MMQFRLAVGSRSSGLKVARISAQGHKGFELKALCFQGRCSMPRGPVLSTERMRNEIGIKQLTFDTVEVFK